MIRTMSYYIMVRACVYYIVLKLQHERQTIILKSVRVS